MDRETLDLLEFDRVLQIIEAQAECPAGKELVRQIRPFEDPACANARLRQIEEASLYSMQNGRFRCGHLGDLRPVLESLSTDNDLLDLNDLLGILQVLKFFSEAKKKFEPETWPSISSIFDGIVVPPGLVGRLGESIDEKGEIRETAYPELSTARREQRRFREKVQNHLGKYLKGGKAKYLISEPYITQRAGRYVIPVRLENQNSIPGIVHGTSSSGATVFLEPLSAVELNNQCIYYREREIEIVQHIVKELSQEARTHLDTLQLVLRATAFLDAVFSCAGFSLRFRCSPAELVDDRRLKIVAARHPLLIQSLGADKVVSLSVELDDRENVLVISGPNNGGKTVALKTVGLLCAMAQAGLPVPAEEAQLPFLKNILADVGDHQSIIQHLSTFSSHIKRMNELLANREYPCLLLLDELGRGTDPTYGAALAVSIVERFRGQETLVIATTHHRAVKSYASSTDGVKNGSVQLDPVSLKPTFVLEFGTAGNSSGLEIAEQLGMRREIIDDARRLLDAKELQVETYLKELRQELQLLERRKSEGAAKLEEMKQLENRLHQEAAEKEATRQSEFEQLLKEWGTEFRSETSRYLKKIKDRFTAAKTNEESKRREATLKEAFRRRMRSAGIPREPLKVDAQRISVGDTVFHSLFEKRGVVISVDQNDARIEISGKRISTPVDKLTKVTEGEMIRKPSERVTLHVVEDSDPELNLIGMSVDEALAVLDKFLDRAFISGLKDVRIVHGFGTGKLKSAVSEHLENHAQVDDFSTDGGATRVTLSQ